MTEWLSPGFMQNAFIGGLLVSLIWGGTWLVIRDQIASVPASWIRTCCRSV